MKNRILSYKTEEHTRNRYLLPLLAILAIFLVASCSGPDVIHDLGDRSFQLLDQDSTAVVFPDDFNDSITVVGFIYTNCPDVCPLITANMSNIDRQLEDENDVHFIGVTFDPERDTPSVLKEYMEQFRLDEERFTFLTGDTATVGSLLEAMDIQAEVSYRTTSDEGRELYFMNHTNRISLLDGQGRVRMEYSGSYENPEYVIEGIETLR